MISNIGASIVRIGFWGSLYYSYNKEPPKQYWYLFRPLYQWVSLWMSECCCDKRPSCNHKPYTTLNPKCEASLTGGTLHTRGKTHAMFCLGLRFRAWGFRVQGFQLRGLGPVEAQQYDLGLRAYIYIYIDTHTFIRRMYACMHDIVQYHIAQHSKAQHSVVYFGFRAPLIRIGCWGFLIMIIV